MEFIKQIGGISETTIGPIDNIGKNYNSIIFLVMIWNHLGITRV